MHLSTPPPPPPWAAAHLLAHCVREKLLGVGRGRGAGHPFRNQAWCRTADLASACLPTCSGWMEPMVH